MSLGNLTGLHIDLARAKMVGRCGAPATQRVIKPRRRFCRRQYERVACLMPADDDGCGAPRGEKVNPSQEGTSVFVKVTLDWLAGWDSLHVCCCYLHD